MLDDKVKILKAVAEKNRLRILKLLKDDTLCVCEIRDIVNLATSTVSEHLKVLKEAGFVVEDKEGKWMNYRINRHPSNPVVTSILGMLDFWLEGEKEIKNDNSKRCCIERHQKNDNV